METYANGLGRFGGLVGLALIAALAVAACAGSVATQSPGGAMATSTSTPTSTSTAVASATPTLSASPTATDTPKPTPTPSAGSKSCPTVQTQPVTDSAPDSRWTVSFKQPVVSGAPAAVATAINGAINARVHGYIDEFTAAEHPPIELGDYASTLDGKFTVGLCSPTLLSLRFTVTQYETGAAHQFDVVSSLNFSVPTGAVISLTSLFSSSTDALTVLDTAGDQLIAADPSLGGGILKWPTSPAMNFFERCWVFTPTGLQFSWDQANFADDPAIAPAAAGVLTTTISWSALHNVISQSGPAAEFL